MRDKTNDVPALPEKLLRAILLALDAVQPIPDGGHLCTPDGDLVISDEDNGEPLFGAEQNEEFLTLWGLGSLPETQCTAIVDHLADCSQCRQGIAEMVKTGVIEFTGEDDDEDEGEDEGE